MIFHIYEKTVILLEQKNKSKNVKIVADPTTVDVDHAVHADGSTICIQRIMYG